LVALELHRLHVELLGGRPAGEVQVRMERLVTRDAPLDVRFVARMVRRAAQRDVSRVGRLPANDVTPSGAWRGSADARNVTSPEGRALDLSRRGALRRVLLALVDAHTVTPDRALTQDVLLAHGWPGERVLAEAASNRVRVAIATLRSLGLGKAIVTRDDG